MGSLTPPPDFRSPTPSVRLIGRYLLCDVIASGGMATVHLGRLVGAEGFSRTVAIKQLYQHFARSQEFVTMFLDEARILSRIRHPHVVAPLDVIVLEGELFIVMEYVHGASLSELLDASGGPIPPRIASAIVVQTLLGLHAAHEATSEGGEPLSIVHRDISPHNVLVGGDGIARVVDFGIAKAESRARTTGDGSLKGKLGYMAPEQLRSHPVDRRTDLFTCGIVLWEALTGERLYAADNIVALFDKLENTAIRLPSELIPSLPRELDDVVRRALTLNPAERVATAREMALELEHAITPASTLETSEWVDGLVGPLLRRRAERISELESVDIADLTLTRLPSNPPGQVKSVAVPVAPLVTATLAMEVPVTLAAPGVGVTAALPLTPPVASTPPTPVASTLDAETPLVSPFAATFQSTPPPLAGVSIGSVGLGGDKGASTPKNRRFTSALLLALPVGVASVAAAFYGVQANEPRPNDSQTQVAASGPSALPSGPWQSTSAAMTAAPSRTLDPPRALAAEAPTSRTESVGPTRLSLGAARVGKPTSTLRSTSTSPAPSAAVPSGSASFAVQAASARPGGPQRKCAVPYLVDDHGVKRFKPECF